MSALALTCAGRGARVTGSDRQNSERIARLRAAGIKVTIGHKAENIGHADLYVYTTAIHDDNPELVAARRSGKPVLHRSQLLAQLLDGHRGIAITGTHGKSTTTAMIGVVFLKLGLDPTVFVGADVPDFGGTHRIGNSRVFIFEACESDGSFLLYKNCSQVLTSIEPDHLDTHGTFERLQRAYAQFLAIADPKGFLAYRVDDPVVAGLVDNSPAQGISFGLSGRPRVTAQAIEVWAGGISYEPVVDGQTMGRVKLQVPGRHNVLNALAATAACVGAGLDVGEVGSALEQFRGVGRRFERLGEFNGALIYDDYAHHPTEVRAALQTARQHFDRKVVAIFQPHLFSRTQYLMDEFAAAFDEADTVIITDIYAAREEPIPGVNSAELARLIARRRPGIEVHYLPTHEEIVDYLAKHATADQLIMTIGAGDIRKAGECLAASGAHKFAATHAPRK